MYPPPTLVGPGSLCKWRPTCHVLKYLKVIIQTRTFLNKHKISSILHDKHNFMNNIEAGFKFRVLWLLGVTSGWWWPGRAGLSLPSPLSLDWGLPPSLHILVQPALWVASQTHAGHSTPPVPVSLGHFHQLTLPPTAPPTTAPFLDLEVCPVCTQVDTPRNEDSHRLADWKLAVWEGNSRFLRIQSMVVRISHCLFFTWREVLLKDNEAGPCKMKNHFAWIYGQYVYNRSFTKGCFTSKVDTGYCVCRQRYNRARFSLLHMLNEDRSSCHGSQFNSDIAWERFLMTAFLGILI